MISYASSLSSVSINITAASHTSCFRYLNCSSMLLIVVNLVLRFFKWEVLLVVFGVVISESD